MTTKEFITKVECLGYYVEEHIDIIYIQKDVPGNTIASVSKTKEFTFEAKVDDCKYFYIQTMHELLYCIGAYTNTPIKEREELAKYYLRLKGTEIPSLTNAVYLNFKRRSGYYFSSNRENTKEYKATFTQKEIDKLPRRLVKSFDKVEVEDEN